MRPTHLVLAVSSVGCQSAPELSTLAIDAQGFIAGVAFVARDPNADLDGGRVYFDFGDRHAEYDLISDDRQAEREGAIIALAYRISACDAGRSVGVDLYAADSRGLESNTLTTTVSVEGEVDFEVEPNDDGPRFTFVYDGGAVGLCGSIETTGTTGTAYTGDHDRFRVRPEVSGQRSVVLLMPSNSDFDLWAFNGSDEYVARGSDADIAGGFRVLELDVPFAVNDTFDIDVVAASGPPGEYSITFE